ncbi:hypothetical protein H634G_05522 [Metarhizium anisopliae BRIP 53293]|uniref:Zn(2)-C6 fungal-type domain-containing protein n=1 Tax=Metarhizium anisopliae BRIP 53293 TaxID=1291518 RepID=A0A0D9NYZ5_METAN|nr:hypothetical protein H634G_05522 [Metarhizium anisopliae BRIP 53293]KJK95603.1 hypothetical protein H633G_00560 [Metarhizium anisopliae BRIP 53284]
MKSADRTRTKCFTGCWTCRARRVKCDEEAPSCRRCRQFGVQCEGYGVRLNWVHLNTSNILHEADHDADTSSLHKTPRRALAHLGVSSIPRLPSPEVDVALSYIDEWAPGPDRRLDQGGFSVFAIDSVRSETSDLALPTPSDSAYRDTTHQTIDDGGGWIPSSSTISPSASETRRVRDTVPVAQTLLSLSNNDFNRPSTPTDTVPKQRRKQPSPGTPRHLDALSMPSSQKRLIHHWVTFTSRKLVLIDEPHNPCRIMMLPMALRGLMSNAKESNSNVVIFHALCASAASNLYELSDRINEQDRMLALNHEQQAICHLRSNLAQADNHQDQSFAMAIMACITADAISGMTSRWRAHVTGGLAYLAKLHARGLDEAVVAAFQRHMVSMAILCEVPVPNDLKAFLDDETASEGLEFTFPYYGVSRSFLRAYDRMNSLGDVVNDPSPELEKELDIFQLQQYLNFPTLPPQEILAPCQTHGLVLHHTAKVFYYAGLVFFQRSIRREALDTVQSLVELGIQELESIEKVGRGELGCMMLWPVVVLGAECTGAVLQNRMRVWFRGQRKLGFRNLVVLHEMIESIWTTRVALAGAERNIDWRDIIVSDEFDVFRL